MNAPGANVILGDAVVKILAFSPAGDVMRDLRHALDAVGGHVDAKLVSEDLEGLPKLLADDSPDCVIVVRSAFGDEDFALLERTLSKHPRLPVLLVCQAPSAELLLRAMRIGIREVLPLPLSEAALSEALYRMVTRGDTLPRPGAGGKILSFIPCKGGSGATFLAANFAYALATTENKRVALFDLNLQFGDAALFVFDGVPPTTLADVVREIGRLDASFLASSMVQVTSNFGVLAAPEELDQVSTIKPEHIDRLLDVAAGAFDYVVVDVGRRLDATSIRALDRSDAIYPVLQMTLPFLRDAKRLLNAFHALGYCSDKVHLIANRYVKGGEISCQSVAKTLGQAVEITVPNSFAAVAASVNQGVPITQLSPHDPVAKVLQEMAASCVHGKPERGWLQSIFGMA